MLPIYRVLNYARPNKTEIANKISNVNECSENIAQTSLFQVLLYC